MFLLRQLYATSWFLCALIIGAAGLGGCTRIEAPDKEGALIVATFPEPGTVNLPDGRPAVGFTEEFLGGFAKQQGVPTRFITVSNFEELEILVREGRVHIGAFLNPKPPPKGIVFSRTLSSMPLWVVRHPDSVGPHSLGDLAGREVHTIAGSAAAAALQTLPKDSQPTITELHDITQQDLLGMLANRSITLAAVDELNMRVAANFQPDLQPAVQLFGQREFALAFPEAFDGDLHAALDAYIDESLKDGSLKRLYDSYFGHIQRISPELADHFLSAVKTVLPKYRNYFQRAQERTGLDWRLIAALAYQESKWDPLATSYTNVRGMMMLTEDTADALKVDNRLDPAESIRGGADYLLNLMDQLPDTVKMPDRLWIALAAYNLGMGHLNGARAIAKGLNKDADVWYELKTVLPLMSRPEYYQRLKSGRARGGEAVILVENVRNLYGVLVKLEPAHNAPFSQTRSPARKSAGKKPVASQGLKASSQGVGFKLPTPPK